MLLGRGWSSNSNYAILGCIRGVAQTISYEVSLALLFLSAIFLTQCYDFLNFWGAQEYCYFLIFLYPISVSWLSCILAETNRAPFDFAEGESELVSGFNIEYGRGGFALLFLAEYGRIIFIRYLLVLIFVNAKFILLINFLGIFFCYFFIWVRGTFPRYRYDKLMDLT